MRIRPTALVATLALPAVAAPPLAAHAETLLRLAETATVMVHPDELVATLRAEALVSTAAEAQAKVNALVADAVERAKQLQGVKVSTGAYNVWRYFQGDKEKPQRWQASQTIELKSRDGAPLLTLTGDLQARGLAVGSLGWELAPETARAAREQATALAIKGLRGRADQAATLLGLSFGEFKEVRLDNVRPTPPPTPRMMAMAGAAAAPPPPTAEAEDVEVSATVEADVVLKGGP
jgi:predicted secreted protein